MYITINDDFDLEKIIDSGQCFRPCRTGRKNKADTYRFITGNHVLYISGTDDKNVYDVSCSKNEWDEVWSYYFDLKLDYASIRSIIPGKDTYMKECSCDGEGIRILNQDKWEMLISFIISQRKSIPAIRSCVEKLCERYGTGINTKEETVFLFPTPEQLINVTDKELADCGLGYRVGYIMDAVRKVYYNDIDLDDIENYDDEELFNELLKIKGVGKKVANCVMLFAYHRTSRAPVDVWIQRVIDTFYDGTDPFPDYKDYAGIMQQYVFYHIQNKH